MLAEKEHTIRALQTKKIEQDEELARLRAEVQHEQLGRQELVAARDVWRGAQSIADAEKQAAESEVAQLKRKCTQSEKMQEALQHAVDAETAALEADRARFVSLARELEQERKKMQEQATESRFSPINSSSSSSGGGGGSSRLSTGSSRLSTGSTVSDGGYLSDRSSIGGRVPSPDSDTAANSSVLLNSSLLNTSRTSKRGANSALQKAKEKRVEEARKKQEKQIRELQSQVTSLQRQLAAAAEEGGSGGGSTAATATATAAAGGAAQAELSALEDRMGMLARDLTLSKDASADLERRNAVLVKQLAAANDAAAAAANKVAGASAAAGKGSYKVLHMKENPVAKAMQARAAAMKACKCGRGGAGAAAAEGEAGGASAAASAEMKAALEKLTSERDTARKSGERLKQVFKEVTDAYKGIVYRLTGYHIDQFPEDGEGTRYRVQSMYAERQDDYLVFTEGVDGAVSILDNEFAQQHRETIAGYMGQLASFPGLLGQLTLDLLENTTRA